MISQIQNLTAKSGAAPAAWVCSALVLALLMTGVVIGLFWYLKRRMKKQYFTLWTAAWIGYGVYLVTALGQLKFPGQPLLEGLGRCGIGLSGLFMCWGGLQLVNRHFPERALYVTVALFAAYCLGADFLVADPFWITVVVFGLLGGVGIYAGLLHVSHPLKSTDAKVLGAGLTLWNFYVLLLPFLDRSPQCLAVSHVVAAALAVLIAIAMVLEQGEALAESNYGSLFDVSSDAIFLVDMWFLTIIKANPAAERLTRFPADKLCGMRFGNVCPTLDRVPVNVVENEKLFRAAFRSYERISLLTANNIQAVCEGEVEVVIWRQRPVFQVRMRDVGQRLQSAEQIRRQERLSTVGQLVAGVAHELNNPLAIIIGTAQLLNRRNHLEAPVKKDLECIQKQSERASQIVRDLLSYARPSEPNKTTVHLNRVVTEVLEWRHGALEAAEIQLSTHLASNLPPTKADRLQVEQILTNLIGNAIDALKEKPYDRWLVVSTEETPSSLRVSIQDNGPGIAAEVTAKIYDPFFTTKPVGHGTGLGLTICNTYIREHNGKIWVESEPGDGARFFFELPLLPCEAETPKLQEAPRGEEAVAAPAQSQQRMLIIDDEPDIVTVLESVLGQQGYSTRTASNGDEALEILSQETFDVILSDMRMPGMDGQTLYRRLHETKPALARRVIFVTGDTVSGPTREFLDSTGNLWLGKPFRLNEVLSRVEQVLQLQSPASPLAGPITGGRN